MKNLSENKIKEHLKNIDKIIDSYEDKLKETDDMLERAILVAGQNRYKGLYQAFSYITEDETEFNNKYELLW